MNNQETLEQLAYSLVMSKNAESLENQLDYLRSAISSIAFEVWSKQRVMDALEKEREG